MKDLANILGNVNCVGMDCPQQDNGCDCGIFMLHYIELFCVPSFLQAFEADPHGALDQSEWFKLEDIAFKREHLVKVIMDMDSQPPPKNVGTAAGGVGGGSTEGLGCVLMDMDTQPSPNNEVLEREESDHVTMEIGNQTPPKRGSRVLIICGKKMEVPETYNGSLEYDQRKCDKFADKSLLRQDLINQCNAGNHPANAAKASDLK